MLQAVENGAGKDEWEVFRDAEMEAFFASVKEIRHKYLRLIEVSSPEVEKGYDQLIVATNKGQTAAAQVHKSHIVTLSLRVCLTLASHLTHALAPDAHTKHWLDSLNLMLWHWTLTPCIRLILFAAHAHHHQNRIEKNAEIVKTISTKTKIALNNMPKETERFRRRLEAHLLELGASRDEAAEESEGNSDVRIRVAQHKSLMSRFVAVMTRYNDVQQKSKDRHVDDLVRQIKTTDPEKYGSAEGQAEARRMAESGESLQVCIVLPPCVYCVPYAWVCAGRRVSTSHHLKM